jgi:ferredoxin
MLWLKFKKWRSNMADTVYHELRELLDKIPNGFPATADGLEIRILKKIFTEEEAKIATRMKMKFETAEAMAERTGMDTVYLKKKLDEMKNKGQILGVTIEKTTIYKLVPFAFGIFEFQLNRMDRELAELLHQYTTSDVNKEFHSTLPSLMKVIPVEKEIPHDSVIQPYESATKVIEGAKSWAVADCICKKEQQLLGKRCEYPLEVCLAIAPLENFFDNFSWGRPISKDEALKILNAAEEAGLVHLTSNVQEGHIYICNCCSCCCGMLRGITEFGIPEAVAHSNYRAVVDVDNCTSCGACQQRCHVRAIDMVDTAAVNGQCIGCGLCVSSCPVEAIKMVRRDEADILYVSADEKEWMKKRAESRGRLDYKELL